MTSPKEKMNKVEGRGLRPKPRGPPTAKHRVQKGRPKTKEQSERGGVWRKKLLRKTNGSERTERPTEKPGERRRETLAFDNTESLINLTSVSVE